MWCFYQMAAPRREPWNRLLSSLDKRNRWKSLSECCPSGLLAHQSSWWHKKCVWQNHVGTALPHLPYTNPWDTSMAPINSWHYLMHISSDTKLCLQGVTAPRKLRSLASPNPSRRHHLNNFSKMMWEMPGWCWRLTHRTQRCAPLVFQYSKKDSAGLSPALATAWQTQPKPIAPKRWYPPWPVGKSRCVPARTTSIFADQLLLSFHVHISTSQFRYDDAQAPHHF